MPKQLVQYRQVNAYDVAAASDEAAGAFGLDVPGESLTVQSQSEDADINVLMRRFGITGQFPSNPVVPSYGDFSDVLDYRSALDAVNAAQRNFMEFPADLRARFLNDPQRMLEFVSDDANHAEAFKLGLTKTAPAPSSTPPPSPGSGGGGNSPS